MSKYQVRQLRADDFSPIMHLEEAIFAAGGEKVLGPYYVRLCCEFFSSTCFVAEADGKTVGYLLSFVRDREAYCTTLAIVPEFQGTRVVALLIRSFVQAIAEHVDMCWFTVSQDNDAARALHRTLGAREVDVRKDFYGQGDARIVAKIDRDDFDLLRRRYERLGLLQGKPQLVRPSSLALGAA